MRKGTVIIAVLCLLAVLGSACTPCLAGDREDIMDVVMKLQAMEKDNGRLRFEIDCIKHELATMKSKPAAAAAPVAGVPEGKSPVFSSVGIEFYGYVKADAIYSDSQAAELTISAPVETDDKPEFFLTGRETRLGMNLSGPAIADGKMTGKIETDFWGNTSDGATTPGLRLRQAYLDLKFKSWDLLAGQAWDFFAPLLPNVLHFGYLWQQGNLGDRHPQIRVTAITNDVLGGKLTHQVGVLDSKTAEQQDTGRPMIGAYECLETKFFWQPLYIGVGGVYGQRSISTTDSRDLDMWAATLGLKYKLTQRLSVAGEGYYGANLAAFRAGSTNGVDDSKSVRTIGGFAQLTFDATNKLQFNVGAGIDDTLSDSISTAATTGGAIWSANYAVFANSKYKLCKSTTVGLECMHVDTEYANQNGGDALRVQSSLIYTF